MKRIHCCHCSWLWPWLDRISYGSMMAMLWTHLSLSHSDTLPEVISIGDAWIQGQFQEKEAQP